MKKKLIADRDYQIADVLAIENALTRVPSVLYQLPTGGGKSVVLSQIVYDNSGKNILILAHKRKLLTQLYDRLKGLKLDVGIMYASRSENVEGKILIASIRTAVKDARLKSLIERDWDMVIVDEARHTRTGSYDQVLDALREAHPLHLLLGVDATPYRKDKKRLDKHFQELVVSRENVATLMEKGFLQKCKAIVSPIDKESLQEEVKEVANDYQTTALSEYTRKPKFLNYVINQYKQYGEERQAIVFAVDIAMIEKRITENWNKVCSPI